MSGFVYAMRCGDIVKIGRSSNPAARVSKVNTDTPGQVELVGQIAATAAQELEVHRLLAPWRINGEWFRMEGPVRAFVDMLPPPPPRTHRPYGRGGSPLSALLSGKQIEVARACKTSKSTVSKWISGKQRIPGERVLEVERITGIPRETLRPDIFAKEG